MSHSAVPAGGTGGRGGEDIRAEKREAESWVADAGGEECEKTDEDLYRAAKS